MKFFKNEKGMAFGAVLLVMTVGIILITGMLTISLNENKQAIHQTNSMKAYYIARAGADSMVHRLLTIDKEYWDDFTTLHKTKPTDFGDGQVEVSVLRTGDDFSVVSTGTYRGQKKEVKAVLFYNPYTKFEYAIYSKESMELIQLGALNHDIGSGGEIGFKNPSYENLFRSYAQEKVIMNPEISDIDLDSFKDKLTLANNIQLTQNGQVETTSSSSKFDMVEVSHNSATWKIDTGNANFIKCDCSDKIKLLRNDDSSFHTDTNSDGLWTVIWLKDPSIIQGNIEITGGNNLMFIVEDQLTFEGTIKNDSSGKVEIHVTDKDPLETDYDLILSSPHMSVGALGEEERLSIYLWDNTRMNFNVNGDFYGYIIGPDANVDMKNANKVAKMIFKWWRC
jgi:hypothetical protein